MVRKIVSAVTMIIMTVMPYYEYMMYEMPESENFTGDRIFVIANLSVITMPVLTALMIQKNKQRIIYILFNLSVIAIGDYLYNALFVTLNDVIVLVPLRYSIVKFVVITLKVLMCYVFYLICEYVYEEKSVLNCIIKRLHKLRKAVCQSKTLPAAESTDAGRV